MLAPVFVSLGVAIWIARQVRRRLLLQRHVELYVLLAAASMLLCLRDCRCMLELQSELTMLSAHLGILLSVGFLLGGRAWASAFTKLSQGAFWIWPFTFVLALFTVLTIRVLWDSGWSVHSYADLLTAFLLMVSGLMVLMRGLPGIPRMSPNDMVRHLPWLLGIMLLLAALIARLLALSMPVRSGLSILVAMLAVVVGWAASRSSSFVLSVETAGSDSVVALRESLFLLSPRGVVDYANPAARRMLGANAQTVHFRALCPDWPCQGRTDLIRSDASRVPVVLSQAPLMVDGEQVGIAVSATDVSEFQKAVDDANEARELATRAARARQEFVAVMSHEIRTPLNAILGLAHVLSDTHLDAEQSEWVHTIQQSSDALMVILNDVLDFSRIESGRMLIESVPFAPQREITGVVNMVQTLAAKQGLSFTVDDEQLPAWVQGDPIRLRQIVLNLVSNAIKFTLEGEVHLRASYTDAVLQISVSDTGIGIAADRLGALFEPFTQEDASTTRRFGGTGLGLSISQRLARLMGGDIQVTSEVGQGSTFVLELPLAQCASPASHKFLAERPQFNDLRVLIVEDNAINRTVLRAILAQSNVSPDEAENGQEGVDMVLSGDYDVVFIDLQMPVMDGWEALHLISEALGEQRPFMVSHSASIAQEEANRATANGADWHLPKPARPEAIVEVLLRSRHKDDIRKTSCQLKRIH